MTEEGGFLTRSTSAPASETVLTPELLADRLKFISQEVSIHDETIYLTSREEYIKIMSDPAPYYKTMRQLLGIK